MSVLRPLLSRRGRLVFVATALALIGALVAAPSVGGAAPARVKQFIASLSGGGTGSFTVTVTNCGGPIPLPADCTASSTIGLGAVQIAIPTGLQPANFVSAITPGGTIWNGSYNGVTNAVEVISPGGSNKLNPGQSLLVTFNVPTTCAGTVTFTTKAWGSNSISGTDPFEIKSSQPTLTCATGPGGQTETVIGDFQGTLNITFGGDLSCSFDPTFGSQWSQFHLPTQVNITPGADFVPGTHPKIATSRFPAGTADSSSYLTCFAVPTAGHTAFTTRGGSPAIVVPIGGTDFFVGILPNCYDPVTGLTRPEPCQSEQFLDLATDEIVISIRMLPGDPHRN